MKSTNIKHLWFSKGDGWQVTSFDPREDEAIGCKAEEHELYVDLVSYKKLESRIVSYETRIEKLKSFIVDWKEELADCTCDEPEREHETITCQFVLESEQALAADAEAAKEST